MRHPADEFFVLLNEVRFSNGGFLRTPLGGLLGLLSLGEGPGAAGAVEQASHVHGRHTFLIPQLFAINIELALVDQSHVQTQSFVASFQLVSWF